MMRVIDCFGPSAARGHAHGESLRDEIPESISRWEEATRSAVGTTDFDGYCTRFLDRTGCIGHATQVVPDLIAELQGIAEGSGQPFNRIAAHNLMDEQWWYDSTSDAPPPGCSLVAIPTENGHVLAQNMDLSANMEGSQVVLRLGGGRHAAARCAQLRRVDRASGPQRLRPCHRDEHPALRRSYVNSIAYPHFCSHLQRTTT